MIGKQKKGFTLVELLVVIAIIGMLVGILLPAVQAARDAGRRTQNVNNLRNIGLALMSYSESQGSLPAMRKVRPEGNRIPRHLEKYPTAQSSVSWAFELLPFMEQQNIYDRFDNTRACADPSNQQAMAALVPIYANPRQSEALANCPIAGTSAPGTCIHYAANRGLYTTGSPTDPDRFTMSMEQHAPFVGPFVHNQVVTTAHIKDGLSQTIAIGDKWLRPGEVDAAGFPGLSGSGGGNNLPAQAFSRGPVVQLSNGSIQPGEPGGLFPTASDESNNKLGGPGGSLAVVYVDGHVTWLEYSTVDPIAYAAQCTINGGEIVVEDN